MEDMVSNRQAGRQQGELATHADRATNELVVDDNRKDIREVEMGSIESDLVVVNLILVFGCIGVKINDIACFIVNNSEVKPRKMNRTKDRFLVIAGEESKRSESRFDCGQRDDFCW